MSDFSFSGEIIVGDESSRPEFIGLNFSGEMSDGVKGVSLGVSITVGGTGLAMISALD